MIIVYVCSKLQRSAMQEWRDMPQCRKEIILQVSSWNYWESLRRRWVLRVHPNVYECKIFELR